MPRDLIAGHRFSNAAAVRHRSIPSHARILENVLGPAKAGFLAPMLCLAVNELPTGQEWTYEVKLDGYRALGLKNGGRVVLGSRNAKDFTRRFSTVALALNAIPDETLIDGEIVAIGDDGLPAFAKLQDSRAGQPEIVFYAFDLPFMHGLDLRSKPLDTRRGLLRELVTRLPEPIRYSEAFEVPAIQLVALVREKGLEGVIAKRRDSTYEAGKRSGAWVKLRANRRQEFVIGGYLPSGKSFDSILVGYYAGRELGYVASIRAGFASGAKQALFAQFAGIEAAKSPFRNLPERTKGRWGEGLTAAVMEKGKWLRPHLVAAIEFLEWTPENRLRHPKFVALREDREAEQVVREVD